MVFLPCSDVAVDVSCLLFVCLVAFVLFLCCSCVALVLFCDVPMCLFPSIVLVVLLCGWSVVGVFFS